MPLLTLDERTLLWYYVLKPCNMNLYLFGITQNLTLIQIYKENIAINGAKIDRVEYFNFLGITIGEKLSWSHHVVIVKKKISKVIGILYRLKNTFPLETLETLYNSLIASYLNYGLLLWGTESHKVFTLQKKAIRLISNSSYICHTNPLFIKLKRLKIGDIYLFSTIHWWNLFSAVNI